HFESAMEQAPLQRAVRRRIDARLGVGGGLREALLGVGAARRLRLAAAAAEVVENLVVRDRPHPAPEGVARLVAAEAADVRRDGLKDFLKDVSRVVVLHAILAAPM